MMRISKRITGSIRRVRDSRRRLASEIALLQTTQALDDSWYRRRHGLPIVTHAAMHYVVRGASQGLSPHPLFDRDFYLERYPDVAAARTDAFLHYVRFGEAEGRFPCPLFDPSYFAAQIGAPERGARLLVQLYQGDSERWSTHTSPLFDPSHYLRQVVRGSDRETSPLEHYLTVGRNLGLSPHPLFDPSYYRTQLDRETAATTKDLFGHFFRSGWRAGLSPSTAFDIGFYLRTNPDIARSGENPFVHYLYFGRSEGRSGKPSSLTRARGAVLPSANEAVSSRASATSSASPSPPAAPPRGSLPSTAEEAQAIGASGLFQAGFYSQQGDDLPTASAAALLHYCTVGWRRGLAPSPYFDTRWYLEQYTDVAAAGANPLWHYVVQGDAEGRWPCPFFDPVFYRTQVATGRLAASTALADYLAAGLAANRSPIAEFDVAFYRTQYPDIAAAGIDPVLHYLSYGHREGRDPSPTFRTNYYRTRHLAGNADVNPLAHFLSHGRRLGLATAPSDADLEQDVFALVRHNAGPGPLFESPRPVRSRAAPRARVIAFYLPQFHPFEENDRWWGEGFTEWRNVARGMPRFGGHYQPRIPRDLGPYDLRSDEVLDRQIELARSAGLGGFCYYYYSFNGKRLLEKPLERLLEREDVDFPFCVMWANENWTRRWDGQEAEVLISQDYDEARDAVLVDDLQRHFADPRYIRIDGRPLLFLYRPSVVPNCRAALTRWRSLFERRHGESPLIFMAQAFDDHDPREHGFDGAIEFPPHKLTRHLPSIHSRLRLLDPSFGGNVFSYDDVVATSLEEAPPPFPLIKTAVPSWDNDARRQGTGLTMHGSTPAKYEAWLERLIERSAHHPVLGERLVFINAWNEWAEAAYLEPDVHFGHAYLNATARAVFGSDAQVPAARVLLVGHDAHPYGAQTLLLRLASMYRTRFGCEVAFLLRSGGPMVGGYERLGEVHVMDSDKSATRQYLERLRRAGYVQAIVNTTASGGALPKLKGAGFHVVSLVHEMPMLIEDYRLERELELLVSMSDRIVFPAELVRARVATLQALPEAKVLVRPQGIYHAPRLSPELRESVRNELGIRSTDRVVLNVASGDLRKGLDLFLNAARALLESRDDVHFVWCGRLDPHVRRWLAADIAPEVARKIHFVDHTPAIDGYFAAADAFFLSSREDPFPSVVMEALACGLPVVGFRGASGTQDLIARHGHLVDVERPGEILDALGAALDERDEPDAVDRRITRRGDILTQFRFDEYAHWLLELGTNVPTISVIVPNYDYARYLEGRIGSILEQSHPIFELIVLDDRSSDESLDVLAEIGVRTGRVLDVVANETNSGSVFRQWRKGVARARGELVWIAEADDLARPDFLSRLAEALRDPTVGFAFCDSQPVDVDGSPLGASYKPYYRTVAGERMEDDFVLRGAELVRECLSVKNLILNVSSVLWRRRVLEEVLERTVEDVMSFKVAGDWRVYIEAALASHSVANVSEPLNLHRRHESSVTSTLQHERHLAEIERIHTTLLERLGNRDALRKRMQAYRAELRTQFGLE